MSSTTTIKLLDVEMVHNLHSPISVRDGTPLGDVAEESQMVLGNKKSQKANHPTDSVTQLITRLDAKIAQVQRPVLDCAVRPCPKPNSKTKPKPKPKPQVASVLLL